MILLAPYFAKWLKIFKLDQVWNAHSGVMVIGWINITWLALVFLCFLRLVNKQVTKVSLLILNFTSSCNFKTLGSRALCLHFRHISLLKQKKCTLKRVHEVIMINP